ncbi:hypothetical protein FRC01_009867, partial [Tulasnella sp. 417]
TTAQKHVENLNWVETCVAIGKVQFTRTLRSRSGGRQAGQERRAFTLSEKEHIVYYLAHRSPYIPPTQKWQFDSPERKRPYTDNVARAGNRIWKELCQSDRPWAKNHSWGAFREQYVRNRAQYDFWIQRYVDENPELLNQVAERLIEDFVDEPGAHEDELQQEEHAHIVAYAPNHSANAGDQWPPARAAGPRAGNPSNGSSSRRSNAPGVISPANTSTRRPNIQQPPRRLERPPPPPAHSMEGEESWLVNSSDEEGTTFRRRPPLPLQSASRIAREDDEAEEQGEQEEQEETANQEDGALIAEENHHADPSPSDRNQVQTSPEDFRRQLMELQAQNSVPVTSRSPRRKSDRPRHSPTSTSAGPSTPPANIQSVIGPGAELSQTGPPHRADSSNQTGTTTTVWPALEESIANPSGQGVLEETRVKLEQLTQSLENEHVERLEGGNEVSAPKIKNKPGRPKKAKATSTTGAQRAGKQPRQSRKPKGFKIEGVSQSGKPRNSTRQEELANSILVYHLGKDGDSAMVRRSSKYGTPSSDQPFSSVFQTVQRPPYNPAEQNQKQKDNNPCFYHRRTGDQDNGRRAEGFSPLVNEASGPQTGLQQPASVAAQSMRSNLSALDVPLRPFNLDPARKVASTNEVKGGATTQPGTRRLRSASVTKR